VGQNQLLKTQFRDESNFVCFVFFVAINAQADYVMISGAGVAADAAMGCGFVDYNYQIGRYEVTGVKFNAAAAATEPSSRGNHWFMIFIFQENGCCPYL